MNSDTSPAEVRGLLSTIEIAQLADFSTQKKLNLVILLQRRLSIADTSFSKKIINIVIIASCSLALFSISCCVMVPK